LQATDLTMQQAQYLLDLTDQLTRDITEAELPFPADTPYGFRLADADYLYRVYRGVHGRQKGLLVLADYAAKMDGKLWYHVSYSRRGKLPDYGDSELVKRLFVGENRWAISVWAERTNHVNIHPYVLHLWSCNERPFPEFSVGGSI